MTDFQWLEIAETLQSGYKKNNIGWLLYGLVRSHQPVNCIEIGVLHGYSSIFIGAALRDNGFGTLYAFDLFQSYPYRNANQEETQNTIDKANLSNYIQIARCAASEVPEAIDWLSKLDFIHIDMSNDGHTYEWAIETFSPLLSVGALLVMEGGTLERDEYEWMIEFEKEPIIPVLSALIGWNFFVFQPFPGLTILRKMQ